MTPSSNATLCLRLSAERDENCHIFQQNNRQSTTEKHHHIQTTGPRDLKNHIFLLHCIPQDSPDKIIINMVSHSQLYFQYIINNKAQIRTVIHALLSSLNFLTPQTQTGTRRKINNGWFDSPIAHHGKGSLPLFLSVLPQTKSHSVKPQAMIARTKEHNAILTTFNMKAWKFGTVNDRQTPQDLGLQSCKKLARLKLIVDAASP